MPSTYTLISSNVLTSSAASVTFSAIPSTYTDLVLKGSARSTRVDLEGELKLTFNSDTSTNYSKVKLEGNGAGVSTYADTNISYFQTRFYSPAANSTSNTFGSFDMYIPIYTSTSNKPFYLDNTSEGNIVDPIDRSATAGLYRGASGISSINIEVYAGNLASGSSFYLYGIKNS